MTDHLEKVLAFEGQVKAVALVATKTVGEAQKRHDTWSAATAALGRTMIGTQLLASSLKNKERLSVQINGDGPGGKIMAEANGQGQMRGYITNPHVSLDLNPQGKLDVRGVVGTQGSLTVMKDLGLKEPFTGQVPLVDGELGMDFTYYMAVSEQINGAIGVSVLVNPDESVRAAGGFMIQLMPGATEETIQEIEQRIAAIPMVSSLIDQEEGPMEILGRLLGAENLQYLDTLPLEFYCSCSKERYQQGLMSLGTGELLSMIDEDHGAQVVCHFCNESYDFSEEDLQELVTRIQAIKAQADQD